MDAMKIATNGIMAATDRFAASAQRTADGTGDPAREAVERITAKAQVEASIAVVHTSDDLFKRLLDIRA